MGKTVRDLLLQALENLEKKSFKKFKNKLNDWDIEEEYARIPRGPLEVADPEDVVDLIRRYYMDSYGMKVTVAVLEAINENREAEELETAWKTVNCRTTKREDQGATSRAPIQETSRGATCGDQEHFVDRHRAQLIQRVPLVGQVLDDLLQNKLLTYEGYDTVLSMNPPQNQMRELYRYMSSWGNKDKDKFLQSLKTHNAPLIKTLEKYYNLSIGRRTHSACEGPSRHGRPGQINQRITDKEHFVDRHRAALIGRVVLVDPILDDLRQWRLLTGEHYDTVRSKTTSQEKMRELYRHVDSWGNKDKDCFLQSLKKNNPPLVRDLERN
ncbi:apoptosis-associated speck-like protein containing a CARD [Ranitomeya variabilis]|uniref:apoptosis-associated speck-like protein containing a CARD n=1 Tax=Ranitomeya variabilis TaxID=490064 RepID=UPI004057188D